MPPGTEPGGAGHSQYNLIHPESNARITKSVAGDKLHMSLLYVCGGAFWRDLFNTGHSDFKKFAWALRCVHWSPVRVRFSKVICTGGDAKKSSIILVAEPAAECALQNLASLFESAMVAKNMPPTVLRKDQQPFHITLATVEDVPASLMQSILSQINREINQWHEVDYIFDSFMNIAPLATWRAQGAPPPPLLPRIDIDAGAFVQDS